MTVGAYGYTGAKGGSWAQKYEDIIRLGKGNCDRVVDTCIGAGNLSAAVCGMFNERVGNDMDSEIAYMFKGLADSKLRRQIIYEALSFKVCEKTFRECVKFLKTENRDNLVKYAATVWFVKNYAYNGTSKSISNKKQGEERLLYNRCDQMSAFDGMVVLNTDVISLLEDELKDVDRLNRTFFIIDPPYLDANPCYQNSKYSTGRSFHKQLCELVRQLPHFILCGFDKDLYEEELVQRGIHKYNMGMKPITSENVDGGSKRRREPEIIWTSFEVKSCYE